MEKRRQKKRPAGRGKAKAAAGGKERTGEGGPRPMATIGSSNIGFQLLKKFGWKEGTGLGAQEQGRLEPVETRVKNNKRGLGSKEPKAKPKSNVKDNVEKDPKKVKQDVRSK